MNSSKLEQVGHSMGVLVQDLVVSKVSISKVQEHKEIHLETYLRNLRNSLEEEPAEGAQELSKHLKQRGKISW